MPGPHCREFCGNPKTVCAGIFLGHSYGAAILHHLALTLPSGHRELRVDRSRSVFTATGGGAAVELEPNYVAADESRRLMASAVSQPVARSFWARVSVFGVGCG